MKFAIPFTKQFTEWQNSNVEIMINYKPKVTQLVNFIEKYGLNKRIDLLFEQKVFDTERDIPIIQGLIEKFPLSKIVVRMPHFSEVLEVTLEEARIPHYYHIFASSWDTFNGLAKTSATDIFVVEDLCFSLDQVKAKSNGKRIRTYCNVCQTSWLLTESIQTFFIRPEDMDLYGKYIDVVEFYYDERYDQKTKYSVWYDIYNYDKKWAGPLKELITNYLGEQDSLYLPPAFANNRLNCGHICGIDKCHICNNLGSISKTLKTAQTAIVLQN